MKRATVMCALLALGPGLESGLAGERCHPVAAFFGASTYHPASECPTYDGPGQVPATGTETRSATSVSDATPAGD